MEVVKPDDRGLARAAQVVRNGGVIVYPTDTAYALGGNFSKLSVEKKILKIKKRKDTKFTLVASSFFQVQRFFVLHSHLVRRMKLSWPAAISFVVSDKYSVRVPAAYVPRSLARRAGVPLIATSANISGEDTPYSAKKIIDRFSKEVQQPDLIIDAGVLSFKKTSTVVEVDEQGSLVFLRRGADIKKLNL